MINIKKVFDKSPYVILDNIMSDEDIKKVIEVIEESAKSNPINICDLILRKAKYLKRNNIGIDSKDLIVTSGSILWLIDEGRIKEITSHVLFTVAINCFNEKTMDFTNPLFKKVKGISDYRDLIAFMIYWYYWKIIRINMVG